MIQIERVRTGATQENYYLIYSEEALLIANPSAEGVRLIRRITRLGKKPAAILLTHTYYDHIGAVEGLCRYYQIPVYANPLERAWLSNPTPNLSRLSRYDSITDTIAQPVEHEFKLTDYEIGGMKFSVIPTPGYSISNVSFVLDDSVVVGDALFRGSIGRTDLHTDDTQQLLHSIMAYLSTLPEEFPVYPGHDDATTIQREKATNPPFN